MTRRGPGVGDSGDPGTERPGRRAAARLGTLAVLLAASTGCTSESPAETPPGCGWVPTSQVVGLLGEDVETSMEGSLTGLRREHTRARCRVTVPGHPERYVTVVAEHHPGPFQLPATSCSAGWVYAGTADKFAPACQDSTHGHGRTRLVVRWQPYLMHVTIGRADRNWAGDAEVALQMSRVLAQRLGVREAAGDG